MKQEKKDDVESKKLEEIFFTPCKSREELDQFIKTFLKITLPSKFVDPDSTSCLLDSIWSVYRCFLTNEAPFYHVVAVNRNGGKTLMSAILAFLSSIHFRRNTVLMGAILSQSKAGLKYFKKFCRLPMVRKYAKSYNKQEIEFEGLPANSFTKKDDCKVVITPATMEGANSLRSNFLILDELDLTPEEILSEVSATIDPTENGFLPVILALSSRKSPNGPIQKKIDDAEMNPTQTKLHKWSLADLLIRCPKVKTPHNKYSALNLDTMVTMWDVNPIEVDTSIHKVYMHSTTCETCQAWLGCRGLSVSQNDIKSSQLMRHPDFAEIFIQAIKDPAKIGSQVCNFKPENAVIVFKSFSPLKHVTNDPNKILDFCNIRHISQKIEKVVDLARILRANGFTIHIGGDYGNFPDPAVYSIVAYNMKTDTCIILGSKFRNGYDNISWSRVMVKENKKFNPALYCPDHADSNAKSYFKKQQAPCYPKKPSKIETGVSFLRMLLFAPDTQEQKIMFFKSNDYPDMELMFEEFKNYKHKVTPLGEVDGKTYVDKFNHSLDSLRYALHPFLETFLVKMNDKFKKQDSEETLSQQEVSDNFYNNQIDSFLNEIVSSGTTGPKQINKSGIKARF